MQIKLATCKCGGTIVLFSLTAYMPTIHVQSQLLLLCNLKPEKMLQNMIFFFFIIRLRLMLVFPVLKVRLLLGTLSYCQTIQKAPSSPWLPSESESFSFRLTFSPLPHIQRRKCMHWRLNERRLNNSNYRKVEGEKV